MSPWNFTLEFHPGIKNLQFFLGIVFKGCLDGGSEEKKYNARYSHQLQTGTCRRASVRTVPPPRDWLSSEGQSELISWWIVPDHIHGTNSSTPMLQYNRSAIAVSWNIIFGDTEGSSWEAFLHGFKISGFLVFDAKNDLALAGDVYPEFSLSF